MIPELSAMRMVVAELTSRRILMGYVTLDVFSTLVPMEHIIRGATDCAFKLYYPVEAIRNVVSRDMVLRRNNMWMRHPATMAALDMNNMGEDNPLLRQFNPGEDGGPVFRLFYVYLAGGDYACPRDKWLVLRSSLLDMVYPYSETDDMQLRQLYDIEIRGIPVDEAATDRDREVIAQIKNRNALVQPRPVDGIVNG